MITTAPATSRADSSLTGFGNENISRTFMTPPVPRRIACPQYTTESVGFGQRECGRLARRRSTASAVHAASAAKFTIVPTSRRCRPETAAAPSGGWGERGRPRCSSMSLLGGDRLQHRELGRPPRGPEPGEHSGDPADDQEDGELRDRG